MGTHFCKEKMHVTLPTVWKRIGLYISIYTYIGVLAIKHKV